MTEPAAIVWEQTERHAWRLYFEARQPVARDAVPTVQTENVGATTPYSVDDDWKGR